MLRKRELRSCFSVGIIALCAHATARAEPRWWTDDFTTVATYNYASLLAPCYGGASTKYTLFELTLGDIAYEQALSGYGKLVIGTCKVADERDFDRHELTIIGALNAGHGCPDVAGLGWLESTEVFTNDYLCIYGGFCFNPWQLKYSDSESDNPPFGDDEEPGVGNVDDDMDGATDEISYGISDESPAQRPTGVMNGFGNRNGTGFWAGPDGAPGDAGVDDDGNGTTDDVGETGSDGSDDSDDTPGLLGWEVLMRAQLGTPEGYSAMLLHISPTSRGGDQAAIAEVTSLITGHIHRAIGDEMAYSFFQAGTQYNYVFCGGGDCYGAMIWTELNVANPDETLGPVVSSTGHTHYCPVRSRIRTTGYDLGAFRLRGSSPKVQ